ncbi:hypothetical protein EVAR_7544_1 [Eumeta japonica]|uniref:Uncharacterized protein n=1 Tax=Eumeta variegata TaxID=151549 RepID=A0A4C1VRW1_EUMVA|nr:hypothetical protein EVAR_7544_1 [Eumeta japonica]
MEICGKAIWDKVQFITQSDNLRSPYTPAARAATGSLIIAVQRVTTRRWIRMRSLLVVGLVKTLDAYVIMERVQYTRTKLCRSDLPANEPMRRSNARRAFSAESLFYANAKPS